MFLKLLIIVRKCSAGATSSGEISQHCLALLLLWSKILCHIFFALTRRAQLHLGSYKWV